jgi:hypothetical protein
MDGRYLITIISIEGDPQALQAPRIVVKNL